MVLIARMHFFNEKPIRDIGLGRQFPLEIQEQPELSLCLSLGVAFKGCVRVRVCACARACVRIVHSV